MSPGGGGGLLEVSGSVYFRPDSGHSRAMTPNQRLPNSLTLLDVALAASGSRTMPSWLSFNESDRSAKVLSLPERDEMEMGVEEHLIVEFYSR